MFSNLIKFIFINILFVALFVSKSVANEYNIKHFEPLSWWIDMQSNQLQLMVNGDNISELTPQIANANITIVKVTTGDSPNYLFIDLKLSPALKAGSYNIDFYKNQQKVISHQYVFNARNKVSSAHKSYGPQDVIYLLTPDRFANGDPRNDNVSHLKEALNRKLKGGRHGGDIQGIINHLDYLQAMGFTQIWTNPMVENDQGDHSYHGYSATDFYQIDPRFGSNKLYKILSKQAQNKGIGLIKDVVLNHIGSGHWWMQDLPMSDWLNYQNASIKNGTFVGTHHKRESLHDPHAVTSDKTIFTDGWFVPTMPDLNQRNPFVATYLIQNTLWWIEFANLSGLRVDTYSYSDRTFLTEWTKRITSEFPNINITGEEWTTNPAHVAYWQRGKINYDGYISHLPSVLDFPLQDALINALTNEDSWNSGLNQLYQAIANDFHYADPYNLVTFADNHDMSRIFTLLNENMAHFKMAMSYILTTRGIPQVFYGTEIAMSNSGSTDHGIIRSDFPGGWSNDIVNAFSRKHLTKQQLTAQNFIKKLLNWRKNATAIHQGKLMHYAPKDGIYLYFRVLPEESSNENVMVIINKSDKKAHVNPLNYSEVLSSYSHVKDVLNNKTHSLTQPIEVDASSATIFNLRH